MNKYLILAIAVILLASCKTAQQRAQRHFERAMRLDPGIISKIKIDTSFVVHLLDTIYIPSDTIGVTGTRASYDSVYNLLTHIEDSIAIEQNRIKGPEKPVPPATTIIKENSKGIITATKEKGGKIRFDFSRKPDTIFIDKPYPVKVSVPGQVVTLIKGNPLYKNWWFWATMLLLIAAVYAVVRNQVKNRN